MSPAQGEPPAAEIASDVATISTKFKVHISKPLMTVAGWPTDISPVDLIAEAIDVGRIRLHLETNIRAALIAKRAELLRGDGAEEYIAAFTDMYREASLYNSATSNDVQLTLIVASHLRVSMQRDRAVYLEARRSVVDIMSPEYRGKRIRDLRGDVAT